MNNKVISKKDPKKFVNFPKLMIDADQEFIVLFRAAGVGMIVVVLKGSRDVGYHSDMWDEFCFKDFDQAVKLKNS